MLTRMSLRFLYSYHRQWYPNYPTYVLFKYKGEEHFIKLHKYGNRYFFGDELKGLRRTHDIYKSVIMHFVAWDKNTTFHVEVMGPLYRRTRERSVATTRHHVFFHRCYRRYDTTQLSIGSTTRGFKFFIWIKKI
ncbi:hypothetical protein GLYMA_01G133050v4 [Glycine max]|nr:hypothetical protein GLYMA_01G133050v4 [Glycine max]KAH1162927.1 hypothetical protein GYH30_001446 [Glycine max]